ncbi:MAG: AAA family ATPase, partial [Lentisphaerae bacterium]|nr:AAA family ATPase [Lentisphaerota bacterium]
LYINQLRNFIDKPFIKVVSGIRRSGKSVLLMLLKDELLQNNIRESQIIYINFESFEFSEIDNAGQLYQFVKEKITKKQGVINNLQKVVDTFKKMY